MFKKEKSYLSGLVSSNNSQCRLT